MRVRVPATVIALALGALLGAAGASAEVSTEHSGWGWSNPQPQGEPLADVSFAEGVGYAVGNFGTALRTVDAGATWTALPTGLFGNLTHVDAVTATTVIIGGGCVLRRSDDGGRTFVRLPWTASESSCPHEIAAIDFPTTDTGYLLLAGGTILRTEDGGQSWARVTAPSTAPEAIVFSSATTGFAAGYGIYRTTDGGTTWTLVENAVVAVSALALDGTAGVVGFAPSGSIGFVSAAMLFTSGDGGQSWTSSTPAGVYPGYAGTHLSCDSATGCLLSGAGNIFRTTDAATFERVTPAGLTPTAAAFAGPTQAVAVTQQGIPTVSADGGADFTEAGAQLPAGFYGLRASSGALATLAGPSGELALTSDGGATWSVLDTPTTNGIADACFLSASTGFAVDATGAVLRTGNGGSSWQTLSAQAGARAILALDSTHVLLAGSHGIERSTTGGQSFAAALTGAAVNELEPAGGALVASGPSHAYASSDGGASWHAIGLPPRFLRTEAVRQLAFTSARAGFLLGTAGRMFATSDGGRHWREVLGLGHGATLSIAFTSARNGWASEGIADGTPGVVLRTSDGGASWRPQRVGDLQIMQLGAAGHEGYALDGIGNVFSTGSAGDLGSPSSVSLTAPRQAAKHGRVTVTGRLVPGVTATSVEINYRAVAGGHWIHAFVPVGAGGKFSLALRVARATAFVAQWAGDVSHAGAGSPAVIVKP